MKFDLVVIATLRPELLKVTLESFTKNLFGEELNDANLIINIDIIGCNKVDEGKKFIEVQSIIEQYDFREILVHANEEPDFAKAWFWAMNHTTNDLIFYLEEDWQLLQKINFQNMTKLFQDDPKLAHMRLSQFPARETTSKNWNKFMVWNGKYFEPKIEDKGAIGFCNHPAFNRRSFINRCLNVMDWELNPEKQIKSRRYLHPMNGIIMDHNFGAYIRPMQPPQIEDIGRLWMKNHGWVKKGNKAYFTTWERDI